MDVQSELSVNTFYCHPFIFARVCLSGHSFYLAPPQMSKTFSAFFSILHFNL